ncbi:MAG: site-specific integrase [Bacteroidales bacterium]|nr:site-specific integrase [Bacteroidales bacterium]
MAKLQQKRKQNPKLEQRPMSDGQIGLYLEYYLGSKREPVTDEYGDPVLYESGRMKGTPKIKVTHLRRKGKLPLYLVASPRTPLDRRHNDEVLAKAEAIRFEREQELINDQEGFRLKKRGKTNLLDFFATCIEQSMVIDKKVLRCALKSFRDFLREDYPLFADHIEAKHLNKDMMEQYLEYLTHYHSGQGIESYFNRFKRILNYAVEKGELQRNPCEGVKAPSAGDILAKDILSAKELQQLFDTHYPGESAEIRRAFAMTCLSGIRRCDIVRLKYSDVDYSNKILVFRQHKTEGHSKASGVVIPLNETLLSLIGRKPKGAADDFIFHLPSDTMCLKALRRWTKKAGIEKHITWHCGRHSFATLALTNGANIKVVSSLLGHSSLRHTEVYVRAVDDLKRKAIDSLPTIKA